MIIPSQTPSLSSLPLRADLASIHGPGRAVFISYAHADNESGNPRHRWLDRFLQFVKPLVRQEDLRVWSDQDIKTGDNWHERIQAQLDSAKAAVLLVSPAFLASDYIANNELPVLLKNATDKGMKMLPIVISPCLYGETKYKYPDPKTGPHEFSLASIQSANDFNRTLIEMTDGEQDRVLLRVAQELYKILAPVSPVAANRDMPPTPALSVADPKGKATGQPEPERAQLPGSVTNPYQPRSPVVPPYFVGREAELRRLALALDRGESVSLVGDWRIGKSSLLATWALEARRRGRTVVELSSEGPEGVGLAEFARAIVGAPASGDPDDAADVISNWAAARGPLPPLILVDEAAHLLRTFDRRFFSRVRGMLGRICWIFATRVEVREVSPDSPLINRLELLRLGLLEPKATEALIAQASLNDEEDALMREWAGRHPFYLQLLGRCLCDSSTAGEALDRFGDESAARLAELWQTLSAEEQSALAGWPAGRAAKRASLRRRGLVDEAGRPFGRVLSEWLSERP